MKTAFLFFFFLVIAFSLKSYGALPPTTLSGMDDATKTTTFNFKVPNKQSTKVAGGTLIEGIESNYIQNPGLEGLTDTTYSTYADAAGVEPVDGTGGSPTVAFASSTLTPLRGLKSGYFVKDAANRQGEGFSTDFTIDPTDKASLIQISFNYSTSPLYADGDMRIYIFDITGSKVIEPIACQNDRDLPAKENGGYLTCFQASPDSVSYRLIGHVSSVSALQYNVEFDNFKVSPKTPTVKGAVVTDWKSYTPSISGFGTPTSVGFFYRRVGANLEIRGSFTSGVSTATAAEVSFPSGLVSTSDLLTYAAGRWAKGVGTANTLKAGLIQVTAGTSYFHFGIDDYTTAVAPFGIRNGDSIASSGQTVRFSMSVPIQGWSSNLVLSEDTGNREISFSVRKSANQTGINPNNSEIKITWNTVENDKTSSFDTVNSRFIAPETGRYAFDSVVHIQNTNVLANNYAIALYKNGSVYKYGPFATVAAVSQSFSRNLSMELDLVKGDYIEVYLFAAGDHSVNTLTSTGSSTITYFSGHKLASPQTIAASETVAFIGENIAGTSVANTGNTLIPFSMVQKDTHNAYNTTTGQYIVPVSGTYSISVGLLFNGLAYSSGNRAISLLYKNGSQFRSLGGHYGLPAVTTAVSTTGSATIFLERGDVLELRAANDRTGGATPLNTFPGTNHLSIIRVGN